MAFKPGNNANPGGVPNHARKALNKIRIALNKAIDGLGTEFEKEGTTVLGEILTKKLQEKPLETLKALQGYMPKDISGEITTTVMASNMSDDQLAEIIAQRAADKASDTTEQPPEPESIH